MSLSPGRTVDAASFRALFSRHPGGVVVVTLDSGNGPVGFTATSLTSVSLDPPLATFAIDSNSSSWPHLRQATSLVVNFLQAQQQHLARQFATSGIDRFAGLAWHRLTSGEPVPDASQRWLRGRLVELHPVGDHHLAVVQIVEVHVPDEAQSALVYHGGSYHDIRASA